MKKMILVLTMLLVTVAAFADTIKLISNKDEVQTYEYNIGRYNGEVVTSTSSSLHEQFKDLSRCDKVKDIAITNKYAMTFADMNGWAVFTNDYLHITIVEKQSNGYYTLYFFNLGK